MDRYVPTVRSYKENTVSRCLLKSRCQFFFFSFLYSDPSCYFSISAVIFRLTEKAKLGEASAKDGEEVPRLDNASLYAVPETNCANTTATVQWVRY